MNRLDMLIDQALSGEAHRPVPVGFETRLAARLRLIAAAQQERKRFRFMLMRAVALLTAVPGLLLTAAWADGLFDRIAWAIPGAMGTMDRLLRPLSDVQHSLPNGPLFLSIYLMTLLAVVMVSAPWDRVRRPVS